MGCTPSRLTMREAFTLIQRKSLVEFCCSTHVWWCPSLSHLSSSACCPWQVRKRRRLFHALIGVPMALFCILTGKNLFCGLAKPLSPSSSPSWLICTHTSAVTSKQSLAPQLMLVRTKVFLRSSTNICFVDFQARWRPMWRWVCWRCCLGCWLEPSTANEPPSFPSSSPRSRCPALSAGSSCSRVWGTSSGLLSQVCVTTSDSQYDWIKETWFWFELTAVSLNTKQPNWCYHCVTRKSETFLFSERGSHHAGYCSGLAWEKRPWPQFVSQSLHWRSAQTKRPTEIVAMFAGALRDAQKTYTIGFYFAGSCLCVTCLLFIANYFFQQWRQNSSEDSTNTQAAAE